MSISSDLLLLYKLAASAVTEVPNSRLHNAFQTSSKMANADRCNLELGKSSPEAYRVALIGCLHNVPLYSELGRVKISCNCSCNNSCRRDFCAFDE